jgi:hypothetical protein
MGGFTRSSGARATTSVALAAPGTYRIVPCTAMYAIGSVAASDLVRWRYGTPPTALIPQTLVRTHGDRYLRQVVSTVFLKLA